MEKRGLRRQQQQHTLVQRDWARLLVLFFMH